MSPFPSMRRADVNRNNKTTIENIRGYPTSNLIPMYPGKGSLIRRERMELKSELMELNMYDLGWRRNINEVFGIDSGNWVDVLLPWGGVK
jgi:hypothetical protein